MRSNYNIDRSLSQFLQHLARLLRRTGTAQVIHPHRKVLQTRGKSLIVLQRQHRRRHQHRHLLVVAGSLERRAHGNFRLSESHIAAHQTVHRPETS